MATTDEMKMFPERFEAERAPKPIVLMRGRYGWPKDSVTCGDCAHLVTRSYTNTYFKCGLYSTSKSATSDFRKSWPGCGAFEVKP